MADRGLSLSGQFRAGCEHQGQRPKTGVGFLLWTSHGGGDVDLQAMNSASTKRSSVGSVLVRRSKASVGLVLLIAALALSAPDAPSAWGKGSVQTPAGGTVACVGATGLMRFHPALSRRGLTTGSEKMTVNLHFSNCVNGSGIFGVFSAKLKGSMTESGGYNCSDLANTTPVSVTSTSTLTWNASATWSPHPGITQTLRPTPSPLTLTQLNALTSGMNGNFAFAWGGGSGAASGTLAESFPGNYLGELDFGKTASAVMAACQSHPLNKLAIVAGRVAPTLTSCSVQTTLYLCIATAPGTNGSVVSTGTNATFTVYDITSGTPGTVVASGNTSTTPTTFTSTPGDVYLMQVKIEPGLVPDTTLTLT